MQTRFQAVLVQSVDVARLAPEVRIGHGTRLALGQFLAGAGHDAALDVQGEGAVLHEPTAFDAKIATRTDRQPGHPGLARGQGQGVTVFDVFKLGAFGAVQFPGGGQGHFQVGGPGQHNLVVEPMIGQKRGQFGIEGVFPDIEPAAYPPAEQGMGRGLGREKSQALDRGRDLADFLVPGIDGQGHMGRLAREQPV